MRSNVTVLMRNPTLIKLIANATAFKPTIIQVLRTQIGTTPLAHIFAIRRQLTVLVQPQILIKPIANATAFKRTMIQVLLSQNGAMPFAHTFATKAKQYVEQDYLMRARALVEFRPELCQSKAVGACLFQLMH
jgi:hypothetical protein